MSKVFQYYLENQDTLEDQWQEYILEKEWGSGEDKITITNGMFFEWVETQMEN